MAVKEVKLGRKSGSDPNRITKPSIIKAVAGMTRISQDDVELVYDAFMKVFHDLLLMETCPDEIKIPFPEMGKIVLKKRKGKKAGSTYYRTVGQVGTTERYLHTLKEDKPDYCVPFFEFSPKFRDAVKARTERYKEKE